MKMCEVLKYGRGGGGKYKIRLGRCKKDGNKDVGVVVGGEKRLEVGKD